MRTPALCLTLATMTVGFGPAAWSQTVAPQPRASGRTQIAAAQSSVSPTAPSGPPSVSLDKLSLHFDSGSSVIRPQDRALLDQAARLYRDAHPVVMIVSGGTDAVGSATINLNISEARARAVLQGLVARGIPIEHFQLLAKGETDPAIPTADGMAEPDNRVVEIRWR